MTDNYPEFTTHQATEVMRAAKVDPKLGWVVAAIIDIFNRILAKFRPK